MEAEVKKVTSLKVTLEIGVEELRVMVHRLSPDGSFLRGRAENILPENHEEIADELAELLRKTHDWNKLGRGE
jgi:hypothetical protein